MSLQHALRFDEDFIEDCRQSTIPDDVLELGRCYHCQHIAKLSGGLCSDCADPLPDDEED
jgi:predicted amidophosphoribosyltransferase